jgi:hypothetical protein
MACSMSLIRYFYHLSKLTGALSKCPWRVESSIIRASGSLLWRVLRQSYVIRCLRHEKMGLQVYIHAWIGYIRDWRDLFLAMRQVSIVCWVLCKHFYYWTRTWNSRNSCQSVCTPAHVSNWKVYCNLWTDGV